MNTPLGEGDQLYAGSKANLEIQIGRARFVRGGEDTQLGISNLDPDFLQLRIVERPRVARPAHRRRPARRSSSTRRRPRSRSMNAGYYRIEVSDQNTELHEPARRPGVRDPGQRRARPRSRRASSVVVSGDEPAAARDLRGARARRLGPLELHADRPAAATRVSSALRAVRACTASTTSTTTATGAWCRPTARSGCRAWPPGWAPYSTGAWVRTSYYGWTWVDAAPWGWAPFHYGRWVQVGGYWGWAPGPLVARPYYAPALVAFFDVPSRHVRRSASATPADELGGAGLGRAVRSVVGPERTGAATRTGRAGAARAS